MVLHESGEFPATLNDRYSLEGEIGRGGMAYVHLARDVKHQREVAVKVFRPEIAVALGLDRFRREIELVARLNHPHILPLHDSGEASGLLYYVTPYVKGESLRKEMERSGPFPVARAVAIAQQIASALAYAHAENILHRDIKPENILLNEGVAVVADFGIALAMRAASDNRLTEIGLSLGTPQYMSPEQSVGERDLDERSDIYSLACVLFEMLAGDPPFTGRSSLAIIAKRLTDAAPDVRTLRPDVPVGLCRAIAKALAREPEDRFASAAEFSRALVHVEIDAPRELNSVAVMPFLNLSADPENEYFADGITEDIIAQLSKVSALKVISRGSVMRYKSRENTLREIASRLGVSALVDGSVRRAGNRVRIVAELIEAATERHLWGETYDRELTDVFQIQSDVAHAIAAALRAELTSDESTRIRQQPTSDMLAYQMYLQGRHLIVMFTDESVKRGIWFMERALELDPTYALAHAAVAFAYGELADTGTMDATVAYARAYDSANKALAINPDLSEAHCVLGSIAGRRDFDWKTAEREFKRAIELNPNNADAFDLYGRLLSGLQRYEEAVTVSRHAQQLDPEAHRSDYPNALLRAGRAQEAMDETLAGLRTDPSYDRLRATLGWAYMQLGRFDEGIRELEHAVDLSPGSTTWIAQLGQAYGMSGRPDDAREMLHRLEEKTGREYVSPYHMAYIHVGLGEHDVAMDWLERAYSERAGAVYGVSGSFLFAPLRGNPRFTALLRRMNLA